ncbi:Pycsar system effector family protein [Spiroplasma endosymbiont of Polydrusus pterygomalis]|uniref:Pycsar system effector family protein n=1 Tax=Spiroplasma endosymbiont of Polydrusus pterygomalis TaxID=3139327 RepID=UPI003CCABD61
MNNNEIYLLNDIKKQIEKFDIKASILLAFSGALLGISFKWIPVIEDIQNSSLKIVTCFWLFFIFVYVFFLFLALLIFISSILPRNKPKKINKNKTKDSSFYYQELQKMKPSIIKKIISESQETYLSEQIQINAKIAAKKHKMLVCGIIFLILSVITLIICILFHIIM